MKRRNVSFHPEVEKREENKMGSNTSGSNSVHPMIYCIFVSLLLDLCAFTLILPLLPSILDYYQSKESKMLGFLQTTVDSFQKSWGIPESFSNVLLGGIIGSMFSFLQFLASPIIGALSDVHGRKPILILTMIGSLLSYLIWAVSHSFEIFLVSRVVGGISKGNISICTAIVSDTSNNENRGKGMALVGIAFSIGFIIGPMLGAILSFNLGSATPFPALCAIFLLSVNLLYTTLAFQETLPKNVRAKSTFSRLSQVTSYINPFTLFPFSPVRNIEISELRRLQGMGAVYFFYLLFYSGLEFTLTFLTHLRFQFTSMQQGKMFLFMGTIMILVQGGITRRVKCGQERNVIMMGLLLVMPAFMIIGYSSTLSTLYTGLFLYSITSATVVPCITTVVSRQGGSDQKGVIMGVFRSLGALARAIGPIVSSIGYWYLGPHVCYLLGGMMFLLPYYIMRIFKSLK